MESLPAQPDAEAALIGCLLLNRDAVVTVAGWLAPDDFYTETYRAIYAAALDCFRRRVPPDVVTVAGVLRASDALERIGGFMALLDLSERAPTAQHAEYYGRLVEAAAAQRRLITAGGKIAALGFNNGVVDAPGADALAADALALLTEATSKRGGGGLLSLLSVADTWAAERRRDQTPGVPSGLVDLDALLGGFQRSDLVVLAARPGVGKTALALSITPIVAQHGPVLWYSLEMSKEQLLERLASARTGIDAQDVRLRRTDDEEERRLMLAVGQLSELPIWVDDTPAAAVGAMRAASLQFAAQHGTPALIIVDYLQLATSPDVAARRNREQEVSSISRGLKALAKELQVPVLALAQLSRESERRADRVPILSDLRESGGIEQDSDIVVFIHREEMYDKETDKKGVAELHIAKHRGGPAGVVPVRFNASTTQFQNLSTYQAPAGYDYAPPPPAPYHRRVHAAD
jgi:replicative DNA helicase